MSTTGDGWRSLGNRLLDFSAGSEHARPVVELGAEMVATISNVYPADAPQETTRAFSMLC